MLPEGLEDPPPGMVLYPEISGAGVFKGDRLAGLLNVDETKGLLYMQAEIKNSIEIISDPLGNPGIVTLNVRKSRPKIIPFFENGLPKVILEVAAESEIYGQTSGSLSSGEAFSRMQEDSGAVIENHIRRSLRKSQGWEADIFGIGREFHRRLPGEWRKISADWDNIYRDLEVQIKVENKILQTGLSERPPF